jgi:hypothetical protein
MAERVALPNTAMAEDRDSTWLRPTAVLGAYSSNEFRVAIVGPLRDLSLVMGRVIARQWHGQFRFSHREGAVLRTPPDYPSNVTVSSVVRTAFARKP